MAVDTHDDRPDPPVGIDPHVGEKDLRMGIIVGCVMAFGAIALMIIFSLT
jgi:hypothetical protein